MSCDILRLVIEGITVEGAVFRPSDWIERLTAALSTYGHDRRARPLPYPGIDRRHRQMDFLQTQTIEGQKCLVVDMKLRDVNPAAYQFLLEFIQGNCLRARETGGTIPTGASSPHRF